MAIIKLGVPGAVFVYLWMFIRKKLNKSGKVSIQVIDKSSNKYKVIKTIGCSDSPIEIEKLMHVARQWINDYQNTPELDFHNFEDSIQRVVGTISGHRLVGIELTVGKVFDAIGFDQIKDKLFKSLVLYRLVYPKSKVKTAEYFYRYEQKTTDENAIYRYMDKLYNTQKEIVQQISYTHTLQVLAELIQVVFYDVTTIYFEVDQEDELRKTGFSKEGKHQNPQIVLGLLVSKNGYLLAYDIFEGSQFEGFTMIPIINKFKEKYNLNQLVVIADSGLLSNKNIEELIKGGYEFILGGRIKNESQAIKKQINSLELKDGQSKIIQKGLLSLIVNYSEKRAKKDMYNREKGLLKLQKQLRTGKLTKANINNRGYNKYLKLEGQINIEIDHEKFESDKQWDGLKGYLTNTKMSKDEVLENYNQLWQIEKAFRVMKTDLKIRPIFHRAKRRIEAHICLSFVAYKVYKELERILQFVAPDLSPNKVIEIASNIYQLELIDPNTGKKHYQNLLLLDEQKKIAEIFEF